MHDTFNWHCGRWWFLHYSLHARRIIDLSISNGHHSCNEARARAREKWTNPDWIKSNQQQNIDQDEYLIEESKTIEWMYQANGQCHARKKRIDLILSLELNIACSHSNTVEEMIMLNDGETYTDGNRVLVCLVLVSIHALKQRTRRQCVRACARERDGDRNITTNIAAQALYAECTETYSLIIHSTNAQYERTRTILRRHHIKSSQLQHSINANINAFHAHCIPMDWQEGEARRKKHTR